MPEAAPQLTAGVAGARFRYRATDLATGRAVAGEQTGESAYGVRQALRAAGLQVHAIEALDAGLRVPRWAAPLVEAWQARQRRARRAQRADLCDAIATLLDAGMPLEQAVGQLAAGGSRGHAERGMLRRVREHLRAGATVADACAGEPGWFDTLDLAMLATGQRAGDLSGVLRSLSEFHQRGAAVGAQLLGALAYPLALLVAGIGATVFLSLVPLPKLVGIIASAHKQPPWLTLQVVALGEAVAVWWPALLLLPAGCWAVWQALARRIPARGALGAVVHRNPLTRARVRGQIAGLAFTLARLRRSGLPLAEALDAAIATADHRPLRRLLIEASAAIRRGEDLSAIVARSDLDEPEFAQLLQLGERSGELTTLLDRVAARYERACRRSIDRAVAVLGPVAIIVVAALIGTLALAAILPIVQLGDLL